MPVLYFEDFPVGRVGRFDVTYLLTEDEIREMGERWDPQPFHVDPVAAATSVFGGLVASSVHLFGIAVRLATTSAEPVAAVSALGFRSMDNHAPARPGDELSLCSKTIAARLSRSRPGVGVRTGRAELVNQRDELVFSFENAALIACRPVHGDSHQ
jgi:acyl dehydratase